MKINKIDLTMNLSKREIVNESENICELESQFILRLPAETARVLRALLHAGVSLKDRISLDLYNDLRHAVFQLDDWVYCGKIYDLPTIIESLKTIDKKSFFKTADISQILVCKGEDFSSSDEEPVASHKTGNRNVPKKYQWPHGVVAPLKNVRKHRFRKTLTKEFVRLSEVEKEVKTLLRADNEAVGVKWEIFYETEKNNPEKEEIDIFGASISDTDNDEIHKENNKNILKIKMRSPDSSTSEDNSKTDNPPSMNLEPESNSEESNVDYEEIYNIIQQEIWNLETEKGKLQRKINGIENFALKIRMDEILKDFDKEIKKKIEACDNIRKYLT